VGSIDESFILDSRIILPSASVEVRSYYWPEPLDQIFFLKGAVLSCSLTPVPEASRGRPDGRDVSGEFSELGNVIFRPKDMPFHVRNAGGRQRLIYCALNDAELPQDLESLQRDPVIAARAGLNIRDRRIRAALTRLSRETKVPGLASATLAESLLLTALVDLTRYLSQRGRAHSHRAPMLASWQLRRIMDRIKDETLPPPLVTDLALLAGISRRHLTRSFRNMTGRTVVSYVAEAQIARAEKLLRSDLSLKEIAFRLGFADHSGFSTAFRNATGRTPTDYRRQSGARVLSVGQPVS
jgi:AraC family transcriptional regulator